MYVVVIVNCTLYILQVIASYIQESETAPVKSTAEQMSSSYEEGARSFPHIPDDDTMRDAPSSAYKRQQRVGQEHMFHQKVSGV